MHSPDGYTHGGPQPAEGVRRADDRARGDPGRGTDRPLATRDEHALSRLRGLFGDELFVRATTGMEPTARAREIAQLVTAAIEHIEAALRLGTGFDPATSAATLTAGMAEYAE